MKQIQFEAEVIQAIQRTNDAKSIRFKKPEGFDYLPGQWISVTLDPGDDRKTKPLSLSSSPTDNFLEITKRLTGHVFSNAIDALRVGDKALLRGPNGKFTFQGEYNKVCMLSAGIGITPLHSMIRYSTDKSLKTDIILLYSNRYIDKIPFKDDLDGMQRRNKNLSVMITITAPSQNWNGLKGRISREMIEKVVTDYSERVFYTSGPSPMVDAMKAVLKEMGIPETQIKQEYFTGYTGALSK
jgi:glycine betaine catabolism B